MAKKSSSPLSRRAWITTASGVVAAGLIKTQADAVKIVAQEVPTPAQDPTKVPGRLTSELGQRAPAEQPRRLVRSPNLSSSSRTPLQDLYGVITPADLHFERHHAGIPNIIQEEHELLVHGMVERPMVFSMADLKRYPQTSRIRFVECSGNGGGAYNRDRMPTEVTPQSLDGLLSTSEWTGVVLSTLLREVGIRNGASWILAEGSDAAVMSRSVPLEKAMDDAMLAYGQNGEAIRPEQGYPLRLLLPGWEGNAQVKWLRRIEITDRPTMTRDETSKYTDPLKGGRARQFSFVMDAKSIITFPAFPSQLLAGGGRSKGLLGPVVVRSPGAMLARMAVVVGHPRSFRGRFSQSQRFVSGISGIGMVEKPIFLVVRLMRQDMYNLPFSSFGKHVARERLTITTTSGYGRSLLMVP